MHKHNLAYITISVDDSRVQTRTGIDDAMESAGISKVEGVSFVDGRIPGEIGKHLEANSLPDPASGFRLGELGVWMSNYYCWKAISETDFGGVIVFEDDAVVHDGEHFNLVMGSLMSDLPSDYDAFSLAPPQKHFYDRMKHYIGSDLVCRSYQGYGCVSTMYSPKGARKLVDFVEREGFQYPVDCFIFEEGGLSSDLDTYAPMPDLPEFVTFLEQGTSIHNTERVRFDK